MDKINCWEFKKCGREPGGNKVEELGVCLAAVEARAGIINNGKCSGRVCWAIVGTLCGGEVLGTFAEKIDTCVECDFYKRVKQEEGADFLCSIDALKKKKT